MDGSNQWYMAIGGHQVGPVAQAEIISNLQNGSIDAETLVFRGASRLLASDADDVTSKRVAARLYDIPVNPNGKLEGELVYIFGSSASLAGNPLYWGCPNCSRGARAGRQVLRPGRRPALRSYGAWARRRRHCSCQRRG